jgi:hypothetical protein
MIMIHVSSKLNYIHTQRRKFVTNIIPLINFLCGALFNAINREVNLKKFYTLNNR